MILTLRQNSSVLEASAQRLTSMEKAAYFIKAIGSNERILLLMAALVVTIVVVYMIRKLPYSYAWAIAIAAGTACYVLTVLVGNVAFGVTVHLLYLSIYTWCSYFECSSCVSLFVRWNAYRIS